MLRESSIPVGISNGDFILKQLQLDCPTNLQNHDIPNSYASKSDFTVQGTVTCDTQGYFHTTLNSRCIWIQHGGLNLPQHYPLNYNCVEQLQTHFQNCSGCKKSPATGFKPSQLVLSSWVVFSASFPWLSYIPSASWNVFILTWQCMYCSFVINIVSTYISSPQ
jgi:hypothetical protein